jgi:hypothetical protein
MMLQDMKKPLKTYTKTRYICVFLVHTSHTLMYKKHNTCKKTQDLQNNVDKEPYKERDRNKIMNFKNMIIRGQIQKP